MIKFRSVEIKRVAYSPHFWAILILVSVITVVYLAWPWRVWFTWLGDLAILEFRFHIIGILFYIPIVYAAVIFWWRGTIITWSLSMAAILPTIVGLWSNFNSLAFNIAFLLFPLMVVSIITLELRWREKERKTLAEREMERQTYMSKVLKAQEDERQRIAQELHNGTMQTLLAIANRAQTLASCDYTISASEVRGHTEWIRDTILDVSEEVRRISLYLRPSVLDTMGLISALRWLVERVNSEYDIDTQLLVNGVERKLLAETEVFIFRIVQEALNNIQRHSKATVAVVTLEFSPDSLKIIVQDNGEGFSLRKTIDSLATTGKLGLIGIQQRVKFLDGTFEIQSRPGEGTLLSIEVKC